MQKPDLYKTIQDKVLAYNITVPKDGLLDDVVSVIKRRQPFSYTDMVVETFIKYYGPTEPTRTLDDIASDYDRGGAWASYKVRKVIRIYIHELSRRQREDAHGTVLR